MYTNFRANRIAKLQKLIARLRSKRYRKVPVIDRVNHLRDQGYPIDRVRHNGAAVGDLYELKSGEIRIAIDAPRGKYRTAWSIIVSPFANLENYA